ncbi:MAG: DnaD domain protein [Chloroflexi bacterium]|nr:DnaD domain protein [Chloroflexota bacterium]
MDTVFRGFPPGSRFTSIPDAFFTALLPRIEDMAELRVTLYVLRGIYLKKGYPRFLVQEELESYRDLVTMAGGADKLREALGQAAHRGTLLRLAVRKAGREHVLYFMNDDTSRLAVEKIVKGQLPLGEFAPVAPLPADEQAPRNIYSLYESNIGLLTPMIAEELKDAEKLYPASWIEDAFKAAVAQNKRRWSYISRILERWAIEGRGDGTSGGHAEKEPYDFFKGERRNIAER